ncbi:MAG TPA: ribonuclease P protein component [Gammaproteobacteria bacterium]|nr:ribonuclease P protein component [Gammaproteobacteria bacterium]
MSRARFPRTARLLHQAEFRRVFQQAERSADSCFTVLARSNDAGAARLGLAISVRRAGNSVQRNRLKRIIRESFRRHREQLPAVDLVVMARPAAAAADAARLRASLERHWERLTQRCGSC